MLSLALQPQLVPIPPESLQVALCGIIRPATDIGNEDITASGLIINFSFSPFFSAVVALGLASSGPFTETFRAGVQSIPVGHIEAARSTGLSGVLAFRLLGRR